MHHLNSLHTGNAPSVFITQLPVQELLFSLPKLYVKAETFCAHNWLCGIGIFVKSHQAQKIFCLCIEQELLRNAVNFEFHNQWDLKFFLLEAIISRCCRLLVSAAQHSTETQVHRLNSFPYQYGEESQCHRRLFSFHFCKPHDHSLFLHSSGPAWPNLNERVFNFLWSIKKPQWHRQISEGQQLLYTNPQGLSTCAATLCQGFCSSFKLKTEELQELITTKL